MEAFLRFRGDTLDALMAGGGLELRVVMLRYNTINVLEIMRAFDHTDENYTVLVVGDDALLLAIAATITGEKRFAGLVLGQPGIVGIDMITGWEVPTTNLP